MWSDLIFFQRQHNCTREEEEEEEKRTVESNTKFTQIKLLYTAVAYAI